MQINNTDKLKDEFVYHLINMMGEDGDLSFEKTLTLIDRVALNELTVHLMAALLQALANEDYMAAFYLRKELVANLDVES